MENRSRLFEEYDKEYGTKEDGEWRFEGTETLYRGLFNLVRQWIVVKKGQISLSLSCQVNHMEELTPSKELETVIKSAVLLR